MEYKKKLIKNLYILLSLALAFISGALLWRVNIGRGWQEGFTGRSTLLTVGTLFTILYYFLARMYQAHKIGLYRLVELSFSQMLSYGLADLVLLTATFFWFHNLERVRLRYFALGLLLQFVVITLIIFILNRLYARFDTPRRILILFGANDYIRLKSKMDDKKRRYDIVGCLPDSTDFAAVEETICTAAVQDVYLYKVSRAVEVRTILYCRAHHIDVHTSIELDHLLLLDNEISHTFDTPFYRNPKTPVMWYYPIVKRVSDIVIAGLGLIVLSPILLVTAAAIRLEDHGPVFYRQKRLTENGRAFDIIKFRSMRVNAEQGGAQLSTVHDDRITKVGRIIRKVRIDELPQLINILKGDMTIVGPRPERPEIMEQYLRELPEYGLRLQVKAGLTGYAQVYGKYNTVPEDKLKLDLIYIAKRSVQFDLQIIFYTLKIIFIPESTEGIADGQTTAMTDIEDPTDMEDLTDKEDPKNSSAADGKQD